MENKIGFTGFRKANIDSINADGSFNILYDDDNNNVIKNVNVINIGSFGSGIFTGYHEGAPIWVAQSYFYQPVIVGFANVPGSIEQGDILESNDIDAPLVKPGEVVIQGSSGAHIDLRESGDIKLSNLNNDGLFLSDAHRSIVMNSQQNYVLSDSGYTIEGRVKRFIPGYLPGANPVFTDLLIDPEADAFTIDVARDQSQKALPMNRARGLSNIIRNPSFAEKRELILEFADSFFVRDANAETELAKEFPKTLEEMSLSIANRRGYGDGEQNFNDLRHASRTNVLRLDDNVIIERVQGTLVDIFGNVLDINYNKLNFPKLADKGKASIAEAHSLLARSVAYHFQINSRNENNNSSTGSGKFTFDIDKEGQFRLNIPRSSTTGTVPTISSFLSNDADIVARTDITSVQLSKSNISAPTGGLVGTAFHDMTLTADRAIRYTLQTVNLIRQHSSTTDVQATGDTPNIEFLIDSKVKPTDSPAYTTTISVMNGIPAISSVIDPKLAGGRSGVMNLEGSLELSLGKDDVDQKSLMLDTAGAFIAWLGINRQGRSAIINSDGEIVLNIGDYVSDGQGNKKFHPGTLAIRVNMADEMKSGGKLPLQSGKVMDNKTTSDHILYLGPQGIVIASGGGTPITLRSGGNIMIESAATLDLKAKEIRIDSGGGVRRIKPSKGDI